MAYDRFDPRYDREGGRFGRESSQSRGRWPDDDNRRWRGEGGRDEDRGWFERAGEQIASWFGDDDEDDRRGGERRWSRDEPSRGRSEPWGGGQFERGRDRDRDRGYQPMAGDYGRSSSMQGPGRGGFGSRFEERQRPPQQRWSESSQQHGIHDPHYHNWRRRQMEELDRDYDDYCRENQSRFESEFGSWRERRQQKRSMLSSVREHMEVVGNDDQPVGTVDRVAGDRIILTKSDPEAGGSHHSISCTSIDRIEDNRVILDCSADQAKQNWRDDDRSRSLNEREDQGEAGPHILNRSFEGTYR
jgi:hypothetical protein